MIETLRYLPGYMFFDIAYEPLAQTTKYLPSQAQALLIFNVSTAAHAVGLGLKQSTI